MSVIFAECYLFNTLVFFVRAALLLRYLRMVGSSLIQCWLWSKKKFVVSPSGADRRSCLLQLEFSSRSGSKVYTQPRCLPLPVSSSLYAWFDWGEPKRASIQARIRHFVPPKQPMQDTSSPCKDHADMLVCTLWCSMMHTSAASSALAPEVCSWILVERRGARINAPWSWPRAELHWRSSPATLHHQLPLHSRRLPLHRRHRRRCLLRRWMITPFNFRSYVMPADMRPFSSSLDIDLRRFATT
jgi:hypothetical protein